LKTDLLVLTDIETTGLDVNEDEILEVGILIADKDLNEVASRSWLVHEFGWYMKLYKAQDPFVRQMHEASGLISDLRAVAEDERMGYGKVTASIFQWLAFDQGIIPGEYPMVGSNIANFDRPFLKKNMGLLEGIFHYRNLDVSSLKVAGMFFDAELTAAYENDQRFDKKKAAHRGVADCRITLEELKFWRDNLFGVSMLDD